MEVYQVGPTEFHDEEIKFIQKLYPNAKWIVYYYEDRPEEYYGSGHAVLCDKDGSLHLTDLSHCSCFGPLESFSGPCKSWDKVSPEAVTEVSDSALDIDCEPEIRGKVKALLSSHPLS